MHNDYKNVVFSLDILHGLILIGQIVLVIAPKHPPDFAVRSPLTYMKVRGRSEYTLRLLETHHTTCLAFIEAKWLAWRNLLRTPLITFVRSATVAAQPPKSTARTQAQRRRKHRIITCADLLRGSREGPRQHFKLGSDL